MTDFEYRLFTNRDVIEMAQYGFNSRELRAGKHEIIWVAEHPHKDIKYVAMFNLSTETCSSKLNFTELGLAGKFFVRDIWKNHPLGTFEESVVSDVPSHGCILLELKNN
jgi:alpha-galactosidase